jgi:hypothetical protein
MRRKGDEPTGLAALEPLWTPSVIDDTPSGPDSVKSHWKDWKCGYDLSAVKYLACSPSTGSSSFCVFCWCAKGRTGVKGTYGDLRPA